MKRHYLIAAAATMLFLLMAAAAWAFDPSDVRPRYLLLSERYEPLRACFAAGDNIECGERWSYHVNQFNSIADIEKDLNLGKGERHWMQPIVVYDVQEGKLLKLRLWEEEKSRDYQIIYEKETWTEQRGEVIR